MVIDRHNTVLARHDLETVRATLGVTAAALARSARFGVWIQAPPAIGSGGDSVEVAVAGRTLTVRLADGTLTAR